MNTAPNHTRRHATTASLVGPSLGLLAALAMFLATGCTSRPEYVPAIDPKAPPPPSMQGYADFFDGKLLVEASLGHGFRMRPGVMKNYAGKNRRRGGSGDIDASDDVDSDNAFADVYYINQDDDTDTQSFLPRMSNSTLPPVALRVRVTNQMQQPVDIVFVECNSMLGNFAVQPEKITVAAGATGSPDPMTSLLGVTGDEIPVRIGLRVGDIKETKIVTLHVIKDAPSRAPAPPPTSATPAPAGK